MTEQPLYVLDASVAAKWHLQDEAYAPQALRLLREFENDRVQLLAPDHFRHEVASAIVGAMQHQPPRITVERAVASIREIGNLGVDLVYQDNLMPMAALMSRRWGCSYYDGLYLALAQTLNRPVIYADEKLRRNLGSRFPLALWIEDYTP